MGWLKLVRKMEMNIFKSESQKSGSHTERYFIKFIKYCIIIQLNSERQDEDVNWNIFFGVFADSSST